MPPKRFITDFRQIEVAARQDASTVSVGSAHIGLFRRAKAHGYTSKQELLAYSRAFLAALPGRLLLADDGTVLGFGDTP